MTSSKQKVKKLLNNHHDWPSIYTFKFIVKGDLQIIAQTQELFNTKTAVITMKNSSKGNYVSITAKEVMNSPEEILEIYAKANEIEDLIAL